MIWILVVPMLMFMVYMFIGLIYAIIALPQLEITGRKRPDLDKHKAIKLDVLHWPYYLFQKGTPYNHDPHTDILPLRHKETEELDYNKIAELERDIYGPG